MDPDMIKWIAPILAATLFILPAVAQEELQIKDIQKGTGEEANVGETVVVHYTGWLMDGTKVRFKPRPGHPVFLHARRTPGDPGLGTRPLKACRSAASAS
jgi:hypothetical protein